MVTVVDAVNFLKDYDEAKYLQEVGESLGEDDHRSVADLLVDQVEFADIILISKIDLVSKKKINKLVSILKTLNTNAEIIPISNGKIEIDKILNTGLFDFEKAQQSPGWMQEMNGEHIPETEEYGISSFVYEARRPFYPEKFHNFLHSKDIAGKLIRSKGFFWLASRPMFAGSWNQAGGIAHHGFAGMFWKAIPKDRWPEDQETLDFIDEKWVEPFGDMRQELVFIGQGLEKEKIIKLLDDCLLSTDDLLMGRKHWETFNDPFPEWNEIS